MLLVDSSNFKRAVSWGAVLDLNMVNREKLPILLVHGSDDPVIPFKHGATMNMDSLKEDAVFPGYRNIRSFFSVRLKVLFFIVAAA